MQQVIIWPLKIARCGPTMKNATIKLFFLIFFSTIIQQQVTAAETASPDSVLLSNTPAIISDSLMVDSLSQHTSTSAIDTSIADTTLPAKKTTSVGMDTTLKYDAKIVDIIVPDRITYLTGDAEVKYKTLILSAEKITVDWNTNLLTAEGIPDTTYRLDEISGDSTINVEWKGLPVLSDHGDIMYGFKLLYNFKSEKGRIIRGRTDYDSGYYFGESMKKVGEDVIYISHGRFTSCDRKDDPHFHFSSRRIKVIPKDRVIAKPVILYFGNVPVAIIPFAVFPNKGGRHSGVVIPSYGQSRSEGRFIRGLGYYWAPNDYFDTRMLIDFYDRSGWLFRGDANYAKRYMLNGHVSGSFTRKDLISGQSQRRWDLIVSHNQTIDPTMKLLVSGRFVSDNSFYRDYSPNMSERLNRQIRSNATFSKNWSEKRMSFSANISQTRDIESDKITQTLPQLRFTLSQRRIFEIDQQNQSTRGNDKKDELKWYNSIYYNYSNNLYNQESKGGDSRNTLTRYFDHNIGLSMNSPSKIFGWLTLGQSLSYQERWYDRYKKNSFNIETNSVEVDTARGFAARRTFSYRLSSSTNIYGMFNPKILNVQAVRHVITPNISFSYRPNFSDPKWGYVDTFIDTTDAEVKAQRFMDAVSSGTQKSMSFSVKNLFQMKTLDDEKEKKFDLFNLTTSSSYNFEAETFKLSNLRSSFRSTIIKNLNFSMSFTHDFYKYDYEQNKRINQLLIFDGRDWWKNKLFRLTNFQLQTSIRLQAKKKEKQKQGDQFATEDDVIINEQGEAVSKEEYYEQQYQAGGSRFEPEQSYTGLNIPWSVNLSFNFSLNKSNPQNPTKSYYVNVSGLKVQLTKNWGITYGARYDLQKKELINQSFTFTRNMHCWEARFVWLPTGIGAPYFYFKINVKSSLLRDLKWEKKGGRRSVFGY